MIRLALWKLRRAVGLAATLPPALKSRETLSVQEIMSRFYPDISDPIESFEAVWGDLEDTFGVPGGLVRPQDRFGIELPLRPFFGISDEDVVLGGLMQRRAKALGVKCSLPGELKSVDAYVRLFFPAQGHGSLDA